jgi:DNA-binding transcriptional regulator LsrR (DeoR family)
VNLEDQIADYLLNHGPQTQTAIVEYMKVAQPNVSRILNNSKKIRIVNVPAKLYAVGKSSRDMEGLINNAIARFATLTSRIDPTIAKYGEVEGYKRVYEQFTTDLEQLAMLAMEVHARYE